MTNDIKQLADITADWCGFDLQPSRIGRLETADAIAEETIRCMLFTLTQDLTARKLFMKVLMNEIEDARRSHIEVG